MASASEAAPKREQPRWHPPEDSETPKLRLYNSLTRKKEEFVPQEGNKVTWYNCGPTVYDASHMGHARTYLSFDILRRVIQDYFGYDVFYVMNITDVDDKIIRRARQNHLFEQYVAQRPSLEKVLQDSNVVLQTFGETVKATTDPDKRAMQEGQLSRMSSAVALVEEAVKSGDPDKTEESRELLLKEGKDLLADWLDKQLGAGVTDNAIFSSLPKYWEERFHEDMAALNVLPADCLTRVSEYIPENVAFIQRIIERGFAYESNGSVYFDVAKFDADTDHYYAKLVPEAYGDEAALREGEGDLSVSEDRLKEKRSDRDFALWKLSKPGEPSWESPWGFGRPGWHIECSVMASAILGDSIDIHTGGFDLKFPHHDNELAQAEAYHGNDHWIRYFLHSGHLTIAGCKMSKSLKNFITIADVLKKYTARQLRLTFLMHTWKDTLDYSNSTMETARSYEKTMKEFFLATKHFLRTAPSSSSTSEAYQKWGPSEVALNAALLTCRRDVHAALCDNVNTRAALDAIRELVGRTNAYLKASGANRAVVKSIAVYATRIFDVLGLVETSGRDQIGFSVVSVGGGEGAANTEEVVLPFLNALSSFRDEVRRQAKTISAGGLLKECDKLRDEIMPDLGVRLEDREEGEATVIKLVGKEELARERQMRAEAEAATKKEAEQKKREAEERRRRREAGKKINPKDMFKAETDKYSKFDERGIPTHNAEGEELTKSQLKKLLKLYQAQEKKYNEHLKSQEENEL